MSSSKNTPRYDVAMSKKAVKGEYIETVSPINYCILHHVAKLTAQDTGNKVSRKSQIIGTTNIILGGKTVIQAEVIIRGDLLRTLPGAADGARQSNVAVAIGRYCFLSKGSCLRPPAKLYKG
jgi:dynactin-5